MFKTIIMRYVTIGFIILGLGIGLYIKTLNKKIESLETANRYYKTMESIFKDHLEIEANISKIEEEAKKIEELKRRLNESKNKNKSLVDIATYFKSVAVQ